MYPPISNKLRSSTTPLAGFYIKEAVNRLNGDSFLFWSFSNTGSFNSLFEECYSEEHSGWRSLRGGKGDIGGPFFVLRHRMEGQFADTFHSQKVPWSVVPAYDVYDIYGGSLWPCDLSYLDYPPAANSDEGQMNSWGAEAVAKAAPGESPMNLATALGELKKDGLPSIVGSTLKARTSAAKKAGDEYLNAQFGWAPLVRDVKSLAKTMTSAADILNQLERDSGQIVRRRLTLQDGWTTHDPVTLDDVVNPSICGIYGGEIPNKYPTGKLVRYHRTYRKVWFSGAFTYYLPDDYYSRNAIVRGAAQTNVLYGLDLNPEVLWNVAPWSWAADWFSNSGEVISNTTRFLSEGLVMHHGYLMEHTIQEYTYWNEGSNVPPIRLITETKGRVKANPFGFGIDWPDLSGFQVSILAALGLSRRG